MTRLRFLGVWLETMESVIEWYELGTSEVSIHHCRAQSHGLTQSDVGRKQHVVKELQRSVGSMHRQSKPTTMLRRQYHISTVAAMARHRRSHTLRQRNRVCNDYACHWHVKDCLDESLKVSSSALGFNSTAKPGKRRRSAREGKHSQWYNLRLLGATNIQWILHCTNGQMSDPWSIEK